MANEERLKLINAFNTDNKNLVVKMGSYIDAVAPYLTVTNSTSDLSAVIGNSNSYLFFRIKCCTIESVDNAQQYINSCFEKLYSAIYSLNRTILFGVVSQAGITNLVLGIQDSKDKEIIETILKGQLSGLELEDWKVGNNSPQCVMPYVGLVSAVPVMRVDEQKQIFDYSTIMRSLNGKDYSLFVCATPINLTKIQNYHNAILEVKNICATVSKRNVSIQEGLSRGSSGTSISQSRRGLVQEVLKQIVRDGKLNAKDIVDSILDGGIENTTDEHSDEVSNSSRTEAFDLQNSLALELLEYCDKALERFRFGQNIGMWNTTLLYSASEELVSNILDACIRSELAKPTTDTMPLKRFEFGNKQNGGICIPSGKTTDCFGAPITSYELASLSTPPSSVVPNFQIKKGKLFPLMPSIGNIVLGKVSDGLRTFDNMEFCLSDADLNRHTFVCGLTGSGKTTTVKGILNKSRKPFLVIESAKKEYRNIKLDYDSDVEVYTIGKPEIHCIQINPFYVSMGVNLQTHIDFLKDLFNASFSFYGPMPYILEKCLGNIYKKKGWNLALGYHPYLTQLDKSTDAFDINYMSQQYSKETSAFLFPTMSDLKEEVEDYIEHYLNYEGEVAGNIKSAMLARLESLCVGTKGYMFNTHEQVDFSELMKKRVVFELEGLADDNDKAFCVGLLIIFINEYRQAEKENSQNKQQGLQHLLVIEEAHRLLKNVQTERSSEDMGNPKGKAVEHFTNMLAEMRSYGQGVIVAEQIPSKLAPDVIKNSSNKIVQRIDTADDQYLMANTIGLQGDEVGYLGRLEQGIALCHKEGMALPTCVKIDDVPKKSVTDRDLMGVGEGKDLIFKQINYQTIRIELIDSLPLLSLKLLNSILALDNEQVISAIHCCKSYITNELEKRNILLLPMTNDMKENLYGCVLADEIMDYLTFGVYSAKKLVPPDIYTLLKRICYNEDDASITTLKSSLKKPFYMRDGIEQAKRVISALINLNYDSDIDIEQSIRQYFFEVPDNLVKEISLRVKGG